MKKLTILIQGLQQQFQQHEQRFIILEKASRPVTPVLQPQPVRSNVGQEIRPKAKGFQLSLERYNWIAQVEEKCALQNISNEEIGKWAKVHLEGNALAYISRLGISDWEEIKMYLQKQFVCSKAQQSVVADSTP